MHSKLYVVKLGFQNDDIDTIKANAEEMIDNYPYGDGLIDYFQSIDDYVNMGVTREEDRVDSEKAYKEYLEDQLNYLCKTLYAEKVNETTVKITKEGLNKYFSDQIEYLIGKLNSYKNENGYDVETFLKEYWEITHAFDDDCPMWYSQWGYREEDGEFIRSLYNAFKFHKITETTLEIVDIWDYHF